MQWHHFLLISNQDSLARAILPHVMRNNDRLTWATDPFAASALMRQENIDAVLVALEQDDEDAAIFCRTVRHYSNAPIVMLVNKAPREQIRRGYTLGADAHIDIPCDPRIFRARIAALLRHMTKPETRISNV